MSVATRVLASALFVLSPLALRADFSYQETTQITGGSVVGLMKMAGAFSSQARKADQPVTTSVYVKGNQMARVYPDRMEIVDLDRDTITQVDLTKRQYSVVTFEQLRQQIEKARQDAEKKQGASSAPSTSSGSAPSNVDMSFDVHVRQTGASQQISGVNTQEAILTMAMIAKDKATEQKGSLGITDDVWAAQEIPGYDEVRAFEQRYAVKLGRTLGIGTMGSMSALLAQPGAAQGLQDLSKEMSKLKGVPIMQVMRMGSTADGQPLPAASEAPLPATATPAVPSAGTIAQQSATSMVANRLGGLGGGLGSALGGGFGRRKKAAVADVAQDAASGAAADAGQAAGQAAANRATSPSAPAPSAQPAGSAATAGVLIESHTTMGSFSAASIDASRFTVPAGFQQVPANKIAD